MTEEKVVPHFHVPRPGVEGNSTKNRGFVTAGDIPANSEGTRSSGITKTSDRLFFEAATVWDARRSTCLTLWKRVPTGEGIAGALT